jgi:hypothetical protein
MASPEHSGVHKVSELYPTTGSSEAKTVPPPFRAETTHPGAKLEVVPTDTEIPPARTPPAPGISTSPPGEDLGLPELYLNRELGYLNFQWRVLHEAADERTPLLERAKFLAIVSSNLDEFFMKRIGGLKQQVGANVHSVSADGRTPQQQIIDCLAFITELEREKRAILDRVLGQLKDVGVWLAPYKELEAAHQIAIREYYIKNIFPLVTPQAMDPAHPFPFVSNLSLNLLVTLHYPNDPEPLLARVKVPVGAGIPRFLRVGASRTFVDLADVVGHNLDLLFPGMEIEAASLFRVTRNAITERDEDAAEDLLELIEIEMRERKFAPVVRLQVHREMLPYLRGRLAAELGLDEANDVFESVGMMGMRDLMEIATLDIPELRDPPHTPTPPVDLMSDGNLFHAIRDQKNVLVHHPYESFQMSVERFLKEASDDPKVRAIKMTLYRTAKDSDVIKSLVRAARNGKQVAVVLELKARFDEEANIKWATRMERAGIHALQGRPRRAPGLRRPAALRAPRDGQLPRGDGAPVHRLRHVHRRRPDRARPDRAVQLPHDRLQAAPQVRQAARRAEDPQAGHPRPHRARDRPRPGRPPRPDPVEAQRARGRRRRARAVPRVAGRRAHRTDRPRHVPRAARAAGDLGDDPHPEHRRAVPRARPGLLLPQRRKAGVLPGLGRHDAAQPRAARRGVVADRRPAAAGRAPRVPRHAARGPAGGVGHAK